MCTDFWAPRKSTRISSPCDGTTGRNALGGRLCSGNNSCLRLLLCFWECSVTCTFTTLSHGTAPRARQGRCHSRPRRRPWYDQHQQSCQCCVHVVTVADAATGCHVVSGCGLVFCHQRNCAGPSTPDEPTHSSRTHTAVNMSSYIYISGTRLRSACVCRDVV